MKQRSTVSRRNSRAKGRIYFPRQSQTDLLAYIRRFESLNNLIPTPYWIGDFLVLP